jgi:hypothetical protein
MPDFTLTPDEVLEPHEPPERQLRLVTTDLAPTEDVPLKALKGPDDPSCYAPCTHCGAMVLTGITPTGTRVVLETGIATYAVDFPKGERQPVLYLSRGIRCTDVTPRGESRAYVYDKYRVPPRTRRCAVGCRGARQVNLEG